jgi:hypothetical protein
MSRSESWASHRILHHLPTRWQHCVLYEGTRDDLLYSFGFILSHHITSDHTFCGWLLGTGSQLHGGNEPLTRPTQDYNTTRHDCPAQPQLKRPYKPAGLILKVILYIIETNDYLKLKSCEEKFWPILSMLTGVRNVFVRLKLDVRFSY